jgi:hypothetical protein
MRWKVGLVWLAGCDPKGSDEGPRCEESAREVAMEEPTELGFSPAQLAARLPQTEQTTLSWADDTQTELALAFRPADSARFVDSEAVYPDGEQPAIAVICEDRVEVDVSWDFVTADGTFDESFDTPLRASTLETASLSVQLDLDALGGTFDLDDWTEETEYDEARAWTDVQVGEQVTSGEVSGQISGSEECNEGQTCSAWAQQVPVGTWGSAEP